MKIYDTNGNLLFEDDADNIRDTLVAAVKADINLTGANLYGADLTGADLTGADINLTGANLIGADLTGADLTGADLYRANLYGANLYGANLTGANLTGANLTGANLTGANLTGANLAGANLTRVNIVGINLFEAGTTKQSNCAVYGIKKAQPANKPAKTFEAYYYVYRYQNRAPVVRHPDLKSAQAEAERLAENHPGICFEILKAVGYARTSSATTIFAREPSE